MIIIKLSFNSIFCSSSHNKTEIETLLIQHFTTESRNYYLETISFAIPKLKCNKYINFIKNCCPHLGGCIQYYTLQLSSGKTQNLEICFTQSMKVDYSHFTVHAKVHNSVHPTQTLNSRPLGKLLSLNQQLYQWQMFRRVNFWNLKFHLCSFLNKRFSSMLNLLMRLSKFRILFSSHIFCTTGVVSLVYPPHMISHT